MEGDEDAPIRSDEQLRIAIVEDDARVRRALTELVESAPDLEVVSTAGTSEDALRNDLGDPADVVLLDMMLPTETEGLHVLRVLRDRVRPVVAISAHGGLRQQALSAGASAFVEKDGREIDVLHDTIRAAGRRRES